MGLKFDFTYRKCDKIGNMYVSKKLLWANFLLDKLTKKKRVEVEYIYHNLKWM